MTYLLPYKNMRKYMRKRNLTLLTYSWCYSPKYWCNPLVGFTLYANSPQQPLPIGC